MRYALIVLLMLFGSVTSAIAQVSIGIGLPSVSWASQRKHRDQPAGVPGICARAGLPDLLRATTEFELFLLRWPVLGLPRG